MIKFFCDRRVLSLLSLAGFGMVAFGEHDYATLTFLVGVFGLIFACVLLTSRRTAFSLIVTWTIIAVVTAISAMKMRFLGFSLHAFDTYFYLRNFDVADLLFNLYPAPVLLCAMVLVSGGSLAIFIFRNEPRSCFRRQNIGVFLALSFLVSYVAYPKEANEQVFYIGWHFSSSFFASLMKVGSLFGSTELSEHFKTFPQRYAGVVDCDRTKPRPDLVVVLMESAMPPSVYPSVKAPTALERGFGDSDGNIHPLQVETFGGATWISTTGLLTSLPTTNFGWMQPYLPLYLEGRIQHSLPRFLQACGYKTAAISPLPYPFVNEGPFMTSLGIEDFVDFKKLGVRTKQEPDNVYLRAAANYIVQHHKTDSRPLFLYIMTMAAHGPYSFRFDPEVRVSGEPFGNDSEMDEYLRRLTMQRAAFDEFIARLKTIMPARAAFVLEFGDHQPAIARPLAQGSDSQDVLGKWNSIAYQTYYKITPINRPLAAQLPNVALLDIAYLAPTLLEVAGLPRDDVYDGLLTLRAACAGALASCSQRQLVESHLKRLINGGQLKLETSRPRLAKH